MEVLKEMMNFSLLSNPLFLLIGISNAFGMIGFYTPFVYLPSMAAQFVRSSRVVWGSSQHSLLQDEISVEDAAFLVSVIGISNTLGRVISGWISDFSWVNSLVVTNTAIILSALTVFLFPYCTSYASLTVMALLFGFFVAAYISLTSIILVDLLGLDNLTSAFGLLTLFRGFSSMIGPPINGEYLQLFSFTENYNYSLSRLDIWGNPRLQHLLLRLWRFPPVSRDHQLWCWHPQKETKTKCCDIIFYHICYVYLFGRRQTINNQLYYLCFLDKKCYWNIK